MEENISPIKNRAKKYAGVYFLTAVLIVFFGVGLIAGQLMAAKKPVANAIESPIIIRFGDSSDGHAKEVDFNLFWTVWDKVKENYVKQPVKEQDLLYGAIQGMVAGLGDPYSVFMVPKETQEFNKSMTGEFSGVGMEIDVRNNQLLIVAPLPGTPAERAGLRVGDKIMAIDKIPTFGMDTTQAVTKIRGDAGTPVVLTIMRSGFAKAKDFKIVREKINVPAVIYSVKNKNVAYLRVMQFNYNTMPELASAIEKMKSANIKKIIVDLRNNPGGYLETAIDFASEWIPEGKIVEEKYSTGEVNPHWSRGEHRLVGYNTVVLVNNGSASASEIVAGALQDHKKARIIGETTFGKGSVQNYEEGFADGSSLKLTVAEWYTPNDNNINNQGVTPDIVIKQDLDKERPGQDVMINKALQLLK
jgi:carboxyl-terminal processing protease